MLLDESQIGSIFWLVVVVINNENDVNTRTFVTRKHLFKTKNNLLWGYNNYGGLY